MAAVVSTKESERCLPFRSASEVDRGNETSTHWKQEDHPINGIGDSNVYGVPSFKALVGAIILVALWQLLAFGLGRGRHA